MTESIQCIVSVIPAYKCTPCLQDHGINEAKEDGDEAAAEAEAAEVEEAVGEALAKAPTLSTLICSNFHQPSDSEYSSL